MECNSTRKWAILDLSWGLYPWNVDVHVTTISVEKGSETANIVIVWDAVVPPTTKDTAEAVLVKNIKAALIL